ncbi:MAG TPA: hypothetical protein P5309_10385 [Syntrophomonadaceae bacterium]|nr:hypothetical protein [Syntrophomonadaceae bacterium]
MDQKTRLESVISHVNMAKRDLENFTKSGMSQKSQSELDLAYNSLNDCINHCHSAIQSI